MLGFDVRKIKIKVSRQKLVRIDQQSKGMGLQL